MANMLNKFFASVFTHDGGCLPPLPQAYPDLMSMADVVFMTKKILKKSSSLKESCSCDPDGLHYILLKSAALALSAPSSIIFSMLHTSGVMPTQWLTAHVTPIYKHSVSRLCTENYRLISFTSIICKFFESNLKDEVLIYLIDNSLINKN